MKEQYRKTAVTWGNKRLPTTDFCVAIC